MLTAFGSRAPLETLGSPLVFKNPVAWESLASDGTRAICGALSLEAPETVDGVVVITSTHRLQKGLEAFSWHHRAEALDWRTGLYRDGPSGELTVGDRPGSIIAATPADALAVAHEWAERVRARLGNEFDVVFGDARHIDHGHAERDGVKVSRVYNR